MGKIHLNRARQNLGQFTAEEIADGLASGRFVPTDLGWREGMESWQPLSTFNDLPAVVPPADVSAPPVAPPEDVSSSATAGSFPWDRRGEIGFVNALWETISQSLGRPTALFAKLPEAPTLAGPYRFYLLMALVTGAINMGITLVFVKAAAAMIAGTPEVASDPQVTAMLAGFKNITFERLLIALLVTVPLAPFLAAAFCHGLLALLGGAKRSFSTTFAVVCYVLGSVSPLQLLLCCGPVVQFVWALVSLSSGLGAAHRTETWRATAAVTIAFLIYLGISALMIGASMPGSPAAGMMPR